MDDRKYSILVYLEESRYPAFSLIFILPILATYEIGVKIINADSTQHTVNAADAILKHAFQALGFYGALFSALTIVLTLVICHMHKKLPWRIRFTTIFFMFIESILVALPLFALDKGVNYVLLAAPAGDITVAETLILSLGAGVYEEFLFRFILLGLLLLIARKVFKSKGNIAQVLCALISAIIFAVFHHLGPLGDDFTLRLFAFRAIAGIYFSWIYLSRGIGIAIGCHTAYDLMVIGLNIINTL
jgi:hypothetical protein